jgi:hypothetical protein
MNFSRSVSSVASASLISIPHPQVSRSWKRHASSSWDNHTPRSWEEYHVPRSWEKRRLTIVLDRWRWFVSPACNSVVIFHVQVGKAGGTKVPRSGFNAPVAFSGARISGHNLRRQAPWAEGICFGLKAPAVPMRRHPYFRACQPPAEI